MKKVRNNEINLTEKRAIITGGASGIGSQICSAFAKAGVSVVILDRQEKAAKLLAQNLNDANHTAFSVYTDLSNNESCRKSIFEAIQMLGGLDIIVNNAAPARDPSMIGEMTNANWAEHEQTVLGAVVNVVETGSKYLAMSSNASVINISSTVSTSIAIDQCSWPYHISKAGLDHLTRWLAVKYGSLGIRVNAIAPGLVNRYSSQNDQVNHERELIIKTVIPLKRAGNGKDIANTSMFLCSSLATYITGQVITVDGGLSLSEVYSTSLRMQKVLQ